ncbi:DsbA family oxidoreductase [Kitasatospora atroaurantiaca]|uniref:Putative DsbA family dithiol-disulfide isomerase n=1 Tax=Kitasatospora atroaurantiaca TaxID=285545 RepID=A0A561ETH2_9ACTN|nr:DsbA family oxidoreductase [Kitasatospora atroaurantiaca]TWE18910.1 putative DsbA family dithiol-disulfide isomerase [Kitasatospora atroaurantiaca]
MKVEIYSDIACPWCYIGKRRFEQALDRFPGKEDVEVVYRPYQLVPDAPEAATPHRAWLAERYGPQSVAMDARVTELGRAEGIDYDFDAALHANTFLGHRLLHLAETEYGAAVQGELKEALLKAHFSDGADVGDREQLAEIAVGAGLDRDRVAGYLAGEEGAEEVRAQLAEARTLGISAVPTFVFEGRWAVQGGQEADTFLRVLEQVTAETAGDTEAAAACTDDSCAV